MRNAFLVVLALILGGCVHISRDKAVYLAEQTMIYDYGLQGSASLLASLEAAKGTSACGELAEWWIYSEHILPHQIYQSLLAAGLEDDAAALHTHDEAQRAAAGLTSRDIRVTPADLPTSQSLCAE